MTISAFGGVDDDEKSPTRISLGEDNGAVRAREDLTLSLGPKWRFLISPGSELYPRYIADPIRPGFAIRMLKISDTTLPDAGDDRYGLRMGGRYGFFRVHPEGDPESGFQLDLEGAFVGQFDVDNSLDNIGWDGLYGLLLTWGDGKGLAVKLAMQHDSSHVGDEYAQRTGRQRIDYTRHEWVWGLSRAIKETLRLYGEAGYGYDLRNKELQKPWRVKGGIEFQDDRRFWKGRAGYYGAIDVTLTEELAWQKDITVQAGWVLPVGYLGRTYRMGVEYRDGRSVIGEFFLHKETYFAFGFWMEL